MELKLTHKGTMSLGALIDELKKCNQAADVSFDFCCLAPTTIASYRGYYSDLALGWEIPKLNKETSTFGPKVSMVLAGLESAVDKTFEGWKGGTYLMVRDTPVWVANRGEVGGTGIVDVEQFDGHTVVLVTKRVD